MHLHASEISAISGCLEGPNFQKFSELWEPSDGGTPLRSLLDKSHSMYSHWLSDPLIVPSSPPPPENPKYVTALMLAY